MNRRRALIVAALILLAAGLSLSFFASTQRAGEVTKVATTTDLFQPALRPSASVTVPPDSILIECPLDAHVGVVDLPPNWFVLFTGSYHWKDVAIVRNSVTKRIEISCIYKDNFAMTRAVSLDYSCGRVDPGNALSPQVRCDLKPGTPRRERRP